MSLQAALIVIGLILLVGIYMVSKMREGKKFNRGNVNHTRHDTASDPSIDSIDDSSWHNSEPSFSEPGLSGSDLSVSGLSEPTIEDDIPVLDMEVDSSLYQPQDQVKDNHSAMNDSSRKNYDNASDSFVDTTSDQTTSDEIKTLDDFVYPDETSDDISGQAFDQISDEAPNQRPNPDQPDISISESIEDIVELEDDLKVEASTDQELKQSSELPMETQTDQMIEVENMIESKNMEIGDGPEWDLELVNDDEQKSLFDENVDDDSEIIDWDNLRSTNAIDSFISNNSSNNPSNNPDDQQTTTEINDASISDLDKSIPESDEQSALSNDEELMDELDDFHFEKDESLLPMQNDPVFSKAKPEKVEGNHRTERIEPKLSGFEVSGQAVLPFADEQPPKHSPDYTYPSILGFDRISQIDYWVKFSGEKDIGRESVLAQYREPVSSISKTSRIYGRKTPDKAWCLLENESEEARFGDLVVTLQLADKNGPVTQLDLDKFTSMIVNLSDGIGRDYSLMAPTESAMQQGKAISDFIRYYETVFVVNIKPVQSDYFDGVTINRCATQLGLDRSADKYFVRNKMVGKEKVSIYYLANMNSNGEFDFDTLKESNIKGVTFFTKPAVNKSPGAVFTEMIDTAKAFAARVKGEAIMPNHEDFSQDDIDHIRKSIEKVAQEMETLGIATGSDEAIRIF